MVPPRASPIKPQILTVGIDAALKEHLSRKAAEKSLALASYIRLTLIEATGFVPKAAPEPRSD